MNEATSFYDAFADKLRHDYIVGNPRMLSALAFLRDEVAVSGARRILDIGCGIGWSSHEMARLASVAEVHAIDLSAQLIATAKGLFASPKITFDVVDVTTIMPSAERPYDAIVMLDVYEHIPVAARARFHEALAALLAPGGFILLTCPTVDHQNYLRQHKPEGLQPVDEDVGLPEMLALAGAIDGTLDVWQLQTVWNPRDYFHAVVRRRAGAPVTPFPRRTKLGKVLARLRAWTRGPARG